MFPKSGIFPVNLLSPRMWTCSAYLYIVTILCFIFQAGFASAAQVTIAWDDYNEPGTVVGYYASCGPTSGYYEIIQDVTGKTSCTFTDLTEGETYYFAVRAYTSTGVESDYSEEFSYQIPVSNIDTDGDGITDTDESERYGTDPLSADTDNDGIDDGQELAFWGNNWDMDYDGDSVINLLDFDSDGDSFSDGLEVDNGTDPADPTSNPDTPDDPGPDSPPVEPGTIVIEAEAGNVYAPMQIGEDGNAYGGEYIGVPAEYGKSEDPYEDSGYAEYTFTVPARGNYIIWARVLAPNTGSDSFFVSMDDGDYILWHVADSSTWAWDFVSIRDASWQGTSNPEPVTYTLEQGQHTLVIRQREAETKIDQILITNTSLSVPTSPSASETVRFEAEDGVLGAPMEIKNDNDASAGMYIQIPRKYGKSDDPYEDSGYAQYSFTVSQTGEYIIWGKVLARNSGSDSFFVSIDGGDFIPWHIADSSSWTWDFVSIRDVFWEARDNPDPEIFQLAQGEHILTIKHREPQTKLDVVIITNDFNLIPE